RRIERINLNFRSAILTICAEMLEALEVSALTLPVSDLVFDKLQCGSLPKVRNRKYGPEDGLLSDRIAFLRDTVHLKKPVVRFALELDEVRDLGRCIDL